jgi:hypothetical protein
METTMARFDPDLLPDRFELDRYARRMRQQEISRMMRAVATAWNRWARHSTGAAPSAAAHGLRMN